MNNSYINKENTGTARVTENVIPDAEKITSFMRQSLDQFQASLICPLCKEMLKAPTTLACAHTFCRQVGNQL